MHVFKKKELSEEQEVARHVLAMGDSVDLINELIAKGAHDEDIHNTITRNVDHLVLMIGKDFIAESSTDLSSFIEAIANGNAFISSASAAVT
jgi:hypothetical protein